MKKSLLIRLLLLIVITFITGGFDLIAQEQAFLVVDGRVLVGRKDLQSANVEIYYQNKKVEQTRSLEDGSFQFILKFDRLYTVEISKFGFVSKKFTFNTAIPKGAQRDNVYNFPLVVELFPPFEEIDMSLLENPLAEIEYDETTMMFGFDLEKATETVRQVQALQAKIMDILETKAKLFKLEFDNAEIAFKQRNYKLASDDYQKALDVYPEKTADLYIDVDYIKNKITTCDRYVADREDKAKQKLALKQYNDKIAMAEKAFDTKKYDEAIALFEEASVMNPKQTKAAKMIEKINKMVIDNVFLKLNKEKIDLANNTEKKFNFTPVKSYQRSGNYLILKVKNKGTEDCKLFIKFGKGKENLGGFVIKEVAKDKSGNHMIRLSSNDKWMRVDANWLSIYPEGSDVEVELIQISRIL